MRSRMQWTACLALTLLVTSGALAQFPGMPGMPGGGAMPGDLSQLLGQLGGMMGGGMEGAGMGMAAAPAPSKYISPLVPLCWAVGRSQYPGIACLYATKQQKAQLEALIRQVAPSIEGRYWVKFADVTVDTDPPSFIREVLAAKYRLPKGGGGAAGAAAGMEGGSAEAGAMGMGMGMEGSGMAGAAAAGSVSDKELKVEARRAAPCIVIFGKDMFSQGAGAATPAAAATAAMPMEGGSMDASGMMGGAMGGTAAPAAGGSKWSLMDRSFMVYWSFVGNKEVPTPEILRFVLDAVGDRQAGIDRFARQLKQDNKNASVTLELARAYVRALERGKSFLPGLGLSADPARARVVQQNQYMADYLLARAETLGGGRSLVRDIRDEQAKLAGSFRYCPPTSLTPMLSQYFPGIVGYYQNQGQRLQLEALLDTPAVQQQMNNGHYWCKLVNLVSKDTAKDTSVIGMVQDEKLDAEIENYPALVLCGQDIFKEGDPVTPAQAAAAGASAGGAGMGMEGMAGAPSGSGMETGGAAATPQGSTSTDDGKLTGWILGGAGAAAAGTTTAAMPGGASGSAPEGMPSGGEAMAEGTMQTAASAVGEMTWSDWDYRQPNRMAYLMQYVLFQGARSAKAIPSSADLAAKMQTAVTIDNAARALKNDKEHDDIDLLLTVGQGFVDLKQHYMADYFLARAEKCAKDLDKKIAETEKRLADDEFVSDSERNTWKDRYARQRDEFVVYRDRIRQLRIALLTSFGNEQPTNQIPVLLTDFPGIIVFYEGDSSYDPSAAAEEPDAKTPVVSRQSGAVRSLLSQPHIAKYIEDKYWVKYIRVKSSDKDPRPGITPKPDWMTRLPAVLIMGADLFHTVGPRVAGGKTAAGAAAAGSAETGAMAGGVAPGMEMGAGSMGPGMEGAAGGAAAGVSSTGDPAEWLPPAGGGAATTAQAGAEGSMSAEAGGAMPMATAAAPAAGGPPQPIGILTGTSPMDGMFAQWADYGHENQLGLRQGYVMVHWSYMGRSQLPREWNQQAHSASQKPEDFDYFRRLLERTYEVDRLAHQAYEEERLASGMTPAATPAATTVLDLASEYVGLPGAYMAEYMLSRAEYLVQQKWEPVTSRVTKAADAALAEQAKGRDFTGGDYLVEIRNFLQQTPEDRSAWMASPAPKAWLAATVALRRMGMLPTVYLPQYVSLQYASAAGDGQGAIASSSLMGRPIPAYFQLPPEKLTDTQLREVRTSAMNALSAGAIGVDPKALWSRLLLVETELRARRGATDIDSSWREIMSLWTSRQQTSTGYSDKILEALDRAVDGEINVLRALNDAGMRMQAAPGSGADMANRTMSAATEENPDWAGSPLSEVASLRDYLKARPHDRAADQARYLMGVMLETGPTANDMRPLTNAASEQYGKLKPMDTPPHWWRFGYGRWDRFQAN
ncbi:MAG: hypothetical protein ABFE16_01575 [Armatimonadia bacterium]